MKHPTAQEVCYALLREQLEIWRPAEEVLERLAYVQSIRAINCAMREGMFGIDYLYDDLQLDKEGSNYQHLVRDEQDVAQWLAERGWKPK